MKFKKSQRLYEKIIHKKTLVLMLLFFLICSSFTSVFSCVSAQNVVENSWNAKASMNEARYGMGVVAVEGKIYTIGGIAGGRHVNTNERYDPKTDKWVTLAPMPTPRAGVAIVAYQNKIYCIGGVGLGMTYRDEIPSYDIATEGWVEVYDIATDSWDIKAAAPFSSNSINNVQAHVVDGKIFVTARSYLAGSYTFDLYMYDPVADSWTAKAGIHEKFMSSIDSFMFDNKITVIGIVPDYSISYKILTYDPNSDNWSEKTTTERVVFGIIGVSTGVYAPQKIYFFPMMPNRPIQVYDPASDTVTNATDMPAIDILLADGTSRSVPRTNFSVVAVDDVFYVMGGLANGESVAVNVQYVPLGYHGTLPMSSGGFAFDNSSIIIAVVIVAVVAGIGIIIGVITRKRKK